MDKPLNVYLVEFIGLIAPAMAEAERNAWIVVGFIALFTLAGTACFEWFHWRLRCIGAELSVIELNELLKRQQSVNTRKGQLYEHHELPKQDFAEVFAEGYDAARTSEKWTDNPYAPERLGARHAAWFQGWQRGRFEKDNGIDYDRPLATEVDR